MQRVERIKEFLLRPVLGYKELYIVYYKHVRRAVLVAELHAAVFLNGLNKVVGKRFRGYVYYARGRIVIKYPVAYGVHKVRFAKTHAAVYEKRVICLARFFRNGLRRGMGKNIAVANNEAFKSILGVKVIVAAGNGLILAVGIIERKLGFVYKADKICAGIGAVYAVRKRLGIYAFKCVFC